MQPPQQRCHNPDINEIKSRRFDAVYLASSLIPLLPAFCFVSPFLLFELWFDMLNEIDVSFHFPILLILNM
jgi:hypothetical protein